MGFHVAPRDGRWALHRAGAKRASYIYSFKEDAWRAARRRAQKDHVVAYLHDETGRIVLRDASGKE